MACGSSGEPAEMKSLSKSWTSVGRRVMAKGEHGYSMLELSVALAIVGVLLAVCLFSIRSALAQEQLDDWVRAITYDIESGRQAAETRSVPVISLDHCVPLVFKS